jgi:hypothetical protein
VKLWEIFDAAQLVCSGVDWLYVRDNSSYAYIFSWGTIPK